MFVKTTIKLTFLLFLLLPNSASTSLFGQEINLLIDTIYKSHKKINNNYLFLDNEKEDLIYSEGSVNTYPNKIQKYYSFYDQPDIIQIDNIVYSSTKGLDFNTSKFVALDLSTIKRKSLKISSSGNFITHQKGDSIFVSNLLTHKTKYVTTNNTVHAVTDQYILLQNSFGEHHQIYNYNSNELTTLPPSIKIPNTQHSHFIVDNFTESNLQVVDLAGKNIIVPADGYSQFITRGNILVVYGNNKEIKLYHKNELLKFDEKYIDVESSPTSNVLFLRASNNKLAVLNLEGNFLSEPIYDDYIPNVFNDKHFILRKGNVNKLYTNDFELVIAEDFDNVKILTEDRHVIVRNSQHELRDKNYQLISTLERNNPIEDLLYVNEFGNEFFGVFYGSLASHVIYNMMGDEVVRWENKENDEYFVSHQFTKGYNVRMINSLSEQQIAKINPSGVWVKKAKNSSNRTIYFACTRDGRRLSPDFSQLQTLSVPNQFLVKTLFSKKFGVIEIKMN